MKRKILQHFADVLCHLFVGWRLGDDIKKVIYFPEHSILTIDVLNVKINEFPQETSHIVGEMHAWFTQNCEKHFIELKKIEKCILTADISQIHSKQRSRLRINCSSLIRTDEKEYQSELIGNECWAFIR